MPCQPSRDLISCEFGDMGITYSCMWHKKSLSNLHITHLSCGPSGGITSLFISFPVDAMIPSSIKPRSLLRPVLFKAEICVRLLLCTPYCMCKGSSSLKWGNKNIYYMALSGWSKTIIKKCYYGHSRCFFCLKIKELFRQSRTECGGRRGEGAVTRNLTVHLTTWGEAGSAIVHRGNMT